MREDNEKIMNYLVYYVIILDILRLDSSSAGELLYYFKLLIQNKITKPLG